MKRLLASALLAATALTAGPAAAWDYCLAVTCGDCTTTPDPQQLRLNINWETNAFLGVVEADDGSWGHPAAGKIIGSKIVFARYNRTDSKQYLYIINMDTFTGTRMQAAYRRSTDADTGEQVENVAYQAGSSREAALTLASCPAE